MVSVTTAHLCPCSSRAAVETHSALMGGMYSNKTLLIKTDNGPMWATVCRVLIYAIKKGNKMIKSIYMYKYEQE